MSSLPPLPPKKRRSQRSRKPSNEIANGAGEPRWTSLAERRELGRYLLANALACGIDTTAAVMQIADHPWLRDPQTERGPHRATVFDWLREVTFDDLELTIDADGQLVRGAAKLDIDERRRLYLGRIDAAVIRWTAQSKALAQNLKASGQPLAEKGEIHKAMIRCEKMAEDWLRMGAQLLHIDKIPPLERLDDPEVRSILRGHLERSLSFFSREELAAWRSLFTDEAAEQNEQLSTLRGRLVQ